MDLDQWKQKIQEKLKGWPQRMKGAGVNSIYAFLGMTAVFPILEAARSGDWLAVSTMAGATAASVGTNLLANVMQNWKDEADAAIQLEKAVESDEGIREEVDLILEKLDVFGQAKCELSDSEKTWFQQTLTDELKKLGNLDKFQAIINGDGVIVKGDRNVVIGPNSIINQGITNIYLGYSRAETSITRGKEARRKYLSYFIIRTCEVLTSANLLSMEAGVSVMLDDIYIDLDTRTPVEKREIHVQAGEGVFSRLLRDEEKYISALQAACEEPRLVLLGDPGSGKSTFVRRLAGWLAAVQLGEAAPPDGFEGVNLLPVLIQLRDLAARLNPTMLAQMAADKRTRTLEEALHQQIKEDLETLGVKEFNKVLLDNLQSGTCFLVLDGLDEVPEAKRACVRETVAILLQQRLQRVVVTCRIRSYNGAAVMPGFKDYTLKAFDDKQVGKFIESWYDLQVRKRLMKEKEAQNKKIDLKRAALSPQLSELSSNPLLLTTMASLHTRNIGLPRQRVTLYRDTIELLLERWQRHQLGKGVESISPELNAFLDNKKNLWLAMEHLAYEAQHSGENGKEQNGEAADLPRWRAREILEKYVSSADVALEFLDYADQRTGLLVGRGGEPDKPGEYSFPHRTFQEYLAGRYLLRQRAESPATTFYAHAVEGDLWDLAVQLAMEELSFNQTQDNILLDLAYQLCPNCDLSEIKNQRAILWSGWAAMIMGTQFIAGDTLRPNGGKDYLERLRCSLVNILRGSLTPLERSEAGDILAKLGDPRFDPEMYYLPREDMLGFVQIPAGEFIMGSDPKRDKESQKNERPEHKMFLPEFYMGRYPVTVVQFRVFVEQAKYKPQDEDCLKDFATRPVRYVTWFDAMAYCEWLDGVLRKQRELPLDLKNKLDTGWKINLPSEAQWEKATRGTDGRIYPWGDRMGEDFANYQMKVGDTSVVGCFPSGASPYGILDMSGNVWEWTRSLWGKDSHKPEFGYPYSHHQEERENLKADKKVLRVMRGGAFYDSARDARCAFRGWSSPSGWLDDLGFRIILSPTERPKGA